MMAEYEALDEKFGIRSLDISTREYAGTYFSGRIYLDKEHIAALRQLKNDDLQNNNRMAFLHFIKSNNKLICFIDAIAVFKVPVDDVVEAVVNQIEEVYAVYLYRYSNRIKLLYQAMS